MADDPLSVMHDAVWTALEASDDFKTLVPDRNRIKYQTLTQPEALLQRTEADTPAVFLQLAQIQQAALIATNTIGATAVFQVQIITTGQNQETVQAILWAIAKAITDANLSLPANIISMRFAAGNVRQERLSQRLSMFGGGTIVVQYASAWRSPT